MTSEITAPADGYGPWLVELKARYRQVQLKAAVAVNTAMLQFYWELGADMVAKQTQFAWGSGFLNQLSADLMREFPEVKGFSKRNLEQIRRWYSFWNASPAIAQQAAAQLGPQPVAPMGQGSGLGFKTHTPALPAWPESLHPAPRPWPFVRPVFR